MGKLAFTKMHGASNDVIVFEVPAALRLPRSARSGAGSPTVAPASASTGRWCCSRRASRHRRVYRIFNADGGEVEQCGNGALRRRVAAPAGPRPRWRARDGQPAGRIDALLEAPGRVSVNMGPPRFTPSRCRSCPSGRQPLHDSILVPSSSTVVVSSSRSPRWATRAVLFVDDVAGAPVASSARRAATPSLVFPKSVNVGFLQVLDRAGAAAGLSAVSARRWPATPVPVRRLQSARKAGRLAGDVAVDLPAARCASAGKATARRCGCPARGGGVPWRGRALSLISTFSRMTTQTARGASLRTPSRRGSRRRRLPREHPVLQRNLAVLARLRLPHLRNGTTVSLVERQVEVLRERQASSEERLQEFIRVARANDVLAEKIQRFSRRLLRATTIRDTPRRSRRCARTSTR